MDDIKGCSKCGYWKNAGSLLENNDPYKPGKGTKGN
jgi:hypothetical protein